MLPIDNSAGSFLTNEGNILSVALFTYRNELTLPFPSFGNPNDPLFSHKPVVTALAINPAIWMPQNTMTLDLQSLGLMFNSQISLQNNDPSELFGYPNLGRPSDHFNVTPFEAIYVDDQVDQHIRLDKSNYVAELSNFLGNEVEPLNLYLQNQRVGTQVLAPKVYRLKRRAPFTITTGHLVTPETDPGAYTVESNGIAELEAGISVEIQPGTEFKAGSYVWVHIGYDQCYGKSPETNDAGSSREKLFATDPFQATSIEENSPDINHVQVFPNPSNGHITLKVPENSELQVIEIYSIRGNLVYDTKDLNVQQFEVPLELEKGTYLITTRADGQFSRHKLIVL
jgi:hypothetical protein